jgi:hypothetical protein
LYEQFRLKKDCDNDRVLESDHWPLQ